MNRKSTVKLIVALLVGGIVLINRFYKDGTSTPTQIAQEQTDDHVKENGFDRHPATINYSKHARCRMDCRHIDESEIKEILEKGEINYKKSDLQAGECKRRFAVEGISHDRQHLRVIFAPCNDEVTVVTCIDLETEWSCSC